MEVESGATAGAAGTSFRRIAEGGGPPHPGDAPPEPPTRRQKKKKMRKLISEEITSIKSLFAPILGLLRLKHGDMVQGIKAAGNFQVWMSNQAEALQVCGTDGPGETDEQECVRVDADMDEKMNVWRAFDDKGGDQTKWCKAADYSDTLFQNEEGEFNVYYTCMRKWDAEGKERCNTAIRSDLWDRLKNDPLATKQRWYCSCGARYMTKYGVLVEIVGFSGGKRTAMYARAEFPPQDMQDLKCLCVRQMLRPCITPEELMSSLPKLKIVATQELFNETKEGHYKFNGQILDELPELEWYQLYNLIKEDSELGAASVSALAAPPPPP
jgi:hypothetical protein